MQIFLLVGTLLAFLTACGVRTTPTPESAGAANSVVISTFTPVPTHAVDTSQNVTSIPVTASTSEMNALIPGLAPANITVKLEQLKFTCTAVKKGKVYYERTCLKGLPSTVLFQVSIAGREPSSVDFVRTSIKQNGTPDTKVAAELLSFMATLPYQNAVPDDAKAWVESTISVLGTQATDAHETEFAGVKYKLYGPLGALILEMGELT